MQSGECLLQIEYKKNTQAPCLKRENLAPGSHWWREGSTAPATPVLQVFGNNIKGRDDNKFWLTWITFSEHANKATPYKPVAAFHKISGRQKGWIYWACWACWDRHMYSKNAWEFLSISCVILNGTCEALGTLTPPYYPLLLQTQLIFTF